MYGGGDLFGGYAFAATYADNQRLQGFGCGGDDRHRADCIGDAVSQTVGAAFMTGQQRHRKSTRFVQHHDGRVAMFVLRQSIEKAHRDTAGRNHDPLRMLPVGCGKLLFLGCGAWV